MPSQIGGDIEGLWALRDHLQGVPNDILDSSNVLDSKVTALVGDAGWSGDAADQFKASWDRDAGAAVGLADSFNSVSQTVGALADRLHELDTQLVQAEDEARKAGVPVPANGGPFIGPIPIPKVNVAQIYDQACTALKQQADQARKDALAELAAMYDKLAPTKDPGAASQLSKGDQITLGDVVRSLWSTPTAYREVTETRLDALRERRVWLNHVKSSPGMFDELQRAEARLEKRALVGKLGDLEAKFAKIEGGAAGKWPLGRLFRYTIGDASEGLTGVKLAAKWGGGVPVLGMAAAGWLTYVQAKEDHEKGWSWGHAVIADGGSNLAGLAAGTGAEAGIAGALVAAPEGVAAGASVVGGVAAAYGVGTYAYELTHAAHWGDHIQKDGVIEGIGEGFSDASKEWWKTDVVGMGDKIGNSASHVWHSVFS